MDKSSITVQRGPKVGPTVTETENPGEQGRWRICQQHVPVKERRFLAVIQFLDLQECEEETNTGQKSKERNRSKE